LKQKVNLRVHLLDHSPAPNIYQLPTDFTKSGKKGPQFGLGREEINKINFSAYTTKVPGPGAYNTIPPAGFGSPKFSMRVKTADCTTHTTAKIVPGPGNYPIMPSINPKGHYMFSKYKNSAATLFNPPCSVRFKPLSNCLIE
jgi:hypothetical protein